MSTLSRRFALAQLASVSTAALLSSRAAAESVTYQYDALGRLIGVTYGNGQSVIYAYDASGNRTIVEETPGAAAPTGTFSASPGTISQSASSSLSWTSGGATSASIDNGVGAVTPVAGGSVSVSPSTSTTYTLTLTGPGGSITRTAGIAVIAAPTGSLSASPGAITQGGSSTLSWTSANATSASIDNGIDAVTPAAGGSVSVSPGSTTTYTLTLTGPGGTTTRTAGVTVNPPAPTGSLNASPSDITQGGSTTLSWSSSHATSASIDNGVGAVSPASGGSVSVSPSATTTYTLTLTGPGGTASPQASVTVAPSFNATIQVTGSGPVNLRTLANNAGYNGAMHANVTFEVASGVTITGVAGVAGAPNGGLAIETGAWPTSSYSINLILNVAGKIHGGGGRGGPGAQGVSGQSGTAGGIGGDAVTCATPLTINVASAGEIRSGGGGGGGGYRLTPGHPPTTRGGSGGGGGFPNGGGSPGGVGTIATGTSGAVGTTSGGGNGGVGVGGAGAGGNGGPAGSAGASGSTGSAVAGAAGSGGAAGYAIRFNGNSVSVNNSGSINGSQG